MLKIIDRQDSGKTKKLLNYVASNGGGAIICSNPKRMLNKAMTYGISVDKIVFIDYRKYIDDAKVIKNVYIDDLDLFLHELDTNIEGYNVDEK